MKSGVHWTPMVQFVWYFFGRQRVKRMRRRKNAGIQGFVKEDRKQKPYFAKEKNPKIGRDYIKF